MAFLMSVSICQPMFPFVIRARFPYGRGDPLVYRATFPYIDPLTVQRSHIDELLSCKVPTYRASNRARFPYTVFININKLYLYGSAWSIRRFLASVSIVQRSHI